MKILLILCALISTNAFASEKSADLYSVLKEAGIPEQGNGVLHMDQEKIMGIYCHKDAQAYECGLDRDDSTGSPIRIKGANAKKMYQLLAPADLSCKGESCGFFVDAVQCGYNLGSSSPLSARASCQVTSTTDL
ncbi:MAG: hypothetical protein ACXWQO_15800 [Bdellovibrionota bacterium]